LIFKNDPTYLLHQIQRSDLKSKEQITDINFGAYKKPRKIIKTFFKKKK